MHKNNNCTYIRFRGVQMRKSFVELKAHVTSALGNMFGASNLLPIYFTRVERA
jgi:hypothetical protein